MALIMKAAIDNESFRTIAGTASYTIPAKTYPAVIVSIKQLFYDVRLQCCLLSVLSRRKRGLYRTIWKHTRLCCRKNNTPLIAVGPSGCFRTTATEAGSLLDYGFDNFQTLSLGNNDFNMVSGGDVYVPVLVPQPTASPLRTARFRMASIPTVFLWRQCRWNCVMEDVPEETTSFDHESEQNLKLPEHTLRTQTIFHIF